MQSTDAEHRRRSLPTMNSLLRVIRLWYEMYILLALQPLPPLPLAIANDLLKRLSLCITPFGRSFVASDQTFSPY